MRNINFRHVIKRRIKSSLNKSANSTLSFATRIDGYALIIDVKQPIQVVNQMIRNNLLQKNKS